MLCIRTGSNRLNIHTDRYCLCQLVHMWTDRQQTAELQDCRLLHPLRAQHCPHGNKHLQSAIMETNISSLSSQKQTSPVCRHGNKHLQSVVTETNISSLSSWNQTSPDCHHGNKHPPTVTMETNICDCHYGNKHLQKAILSPQQALKHTFEKRGILV